MLDLINFGLAGSPISSFSVKMNQWPNQSRNEQLVLIYWSLRYPIDLKLLKHAFIHIIFIYFLACIRKWKIRKLKCKNIFSIVTMKWMRNVININKFSIIKQNKNIIKRKFECFIAYTRGTVHCCCFQGKHRAEVGHPLHHHFPMGCCS